MCIAADKIGDASHESNGARAKSTAFTLIEITLAVAILGMMSLAIYRFVQTNITALRISAENTVKDGRYDALRELLTAQLQALAPGDGELLGDSLKLGDHHRDEMKWVCGAGPGLLTRYAAGDYTVTMRLQPHERGDSFDLGFVRVRKNNHSLDDSTGAQSWVPLLSDVQSLQVRYFDPRLNAWLDKWTDTVTLPRLVRVTIEREDTSAPWEAMIPLGRTPL